MNDFSRMNWVPVRTTARMLGVSRQRVYQLCNEGKLALITLDGTFFISRSSIELRIIAQRNGSILSKKENSLEE